MKAKIIGSEEGLFPAVNWDRVQILRYGTNLVLSTGTHTTDNFEGVNLTTGVFSNSYLKSYYHVVPPTEKVVIEFQNEQY
jgi:hypothetical protein